MYSPNGKTTYIGCGGDKTKFYEYSRHVMSYVNSIKTDDATLTAAHGGGRINCYVTRHYFTDA